MHSSFALLLQTQNGFAFRTQVQVLHFQQAGRAFKAEPSIDTRAGFAARYVKPYSPCLSTSRDLLLPQLPSRRSQALR